MDDCWERFDMSGILQMFGYSRGSGLTVPGAPTIGTATATGSTTATVAYTAPANDGGSTITSYTATSSPGGITGTLSQAGSGTITVSGLTASTSYTFTVYATNAIGNSASSAASNSITTQVATGQQEYTTAGTYSWVAPTGVTSVSAVAVGGGGSGYFASFQPVRSGGGGGLGYANNISVTPGNSYTVVVGAGGAAQTVAGSNGNAGGESRFVTSCYGYGGQGGGNGSGGGGGGFSGDGGGSGGSTLISGNLYCGGGGAGGYAGTGGFGGDDNGGATAGAGGAGGGGGGGNRDTSPCPIVYYAPFNGGGVGLLGQGANGSAGVTPNSGNGFVGSAGGSGSGGGYGFGGNSNGGFVIGATQSGAGGGGAVRIIWPGTTRSFPSTNTGNL
jgi:hypothetical protein